MSATSWPVVQHSNSPKRASVGIRGSFYMITPDMADPIPLDDASAELLRPALKLERFFPGRLKAKDVRNLFTHSGLYRYAAQVPSRVAGPEPRRPAPPLLRLDAPPSGQRLVPDERPRRLLGRRLGGGVGGVKGPAQVVGRRRGACRRCEARAEGAVRLG